ncbi:ABC transporter permease [Dactylosporangium sp. NPDC051541]|uniref:ABC transporter permease n=1 Tax=Dactylosporangium sp. NPDC051541 TaxID=3363977 RepID=UPI0037AB6CF8
MLYELCAYQLRIFVRAPRTLIAAAGTPLALIVLLAAISDHAREPGYHWRLVASMITLGVASTCYTTLAASLVASRDTGVLKRLRATPLPLWQHVGGRVAATVVVAVVQSVLVGVLGFALYSARPAAWAWLIAGLLLGAIAVGLIGVAVAQLVPRGDAAATLLSTTLLPVVLLSGVFFPVGELPAWAAALAEASPLTHLNRLLGAAPATLTESWTAVAVLVAWSAAALAFALWRFRVDPLPPRTSRRDRTAPA